MITIARGKTLPLAIFSARLATDCAPSLLSVPAPPCRWQARANYSCSGLLLLDRVGVFN